MFFKKKKRANSDAETEKFILELANIGYDFKNECEFINDEVRSGAAEIALKHYLEKDPEDRNYSASDFYIRVLLNNIANNIGDGTATIQESGSWYTQLDKVLRHHPEYRSDFIQQLMNEWRRGLDQHGVMLFT